MEMQRATKKRKPEALVITKGGLPYFNSFVLELKLLFQANP